MTGKGARGVIRAFAINPLFDLKTPIRRLCSVGGPSKLLRLFETKCDLDADTGNGRDDDDDGDVMNQNDVDEDLTQEWGLVEMVPQPASKAAQENGNAEKLRYCNVVPFDHSRVLLSKLKAEESSTFINANWVEGFNRENEYIATQGPLETTFHDFWRLSWEHNVGIIVMVTNLKENGRVKCAQYWPKSGSRTYGTSADSFHVKVLNERTEGTVVIRTLKLRKGNDKKDSRKLVQYHYKGWPDHGVPDLDAFARFVEMYRSEAESQNIAAAAKGEDSPGPIVVHCSAGVGRTGTTIASDILIQSVKQGQPIDVKECVSRLRKARMWMVQTRAQYRFVYETVLAALKRSRIADGSAATEAVDEGAITAKSPSKLKFNATTPVRKTGVDRKRSRAPYRPVVEVGAVDESAITAKTPSKFLSSVNTLVRTTSMERRRREIEDDDKGMSSTPHKRRRIPK